MGQAFFAARQIRLQNLERERQARVAAGQDPAEVENLLGPEIKRLQAGPFRAPSEWQPIPEYGRLAGKVLGSREETREREVSVPPPPLPTDFSQVRSEDPSIAVPGAMNVSDVVAPPGAFGPALQFAPTTEKFRETVRVPGPTTLAEVPWERLSPDERRAVEVRGSPWFTANKELRAAQAASRVRQRIAEGMDEEEALALETGRLPKEVSDEVRARVGLRRERRLEDTELAKQERITEAQTALKEEESKFIAEGRGDLARLLRMSAGTLDNREVVRQIAQTLRTEHQEGARTERAEKGIASRQKIAQMRVAALDRLEGTRQRGREALAKLRSSLRTKEPGSVETRAARRDVLNYRRDARVELRSLRKLYEDSRDRKQKEDLSLDMELLEQEIDDADDELSELGLFGKTQPVQPTGGAEVEPRTVEKPIAPVPPPAASKATAPESQLPPAASYKGKTVVHDQSGRKFRSNGTRWIEVK